MIDRVLRALESSHFAGLVRGELPDELSWEGWVFPSIETVHVLALSMVFGLIFMVDLRLLGLSHRDTPVTSLTRALLPWTWTAFGVAAASGFALFISKASAYYYDLPFRLKFLLMASAAVNLLAFHFGVYRSAAAWDQASPPGPARVAGALSIALWLAIIFCGRWVGFTT